MTGPERTDYMAMAMAERAELADLASTLTPAQWAAPSLSGSWTVRDVIAHVFSYDELSTVGLVGRFIRGAVTKGGPNAVALAAYANRSPAELVLLARACQRPRGLTSGFGGRIALTDGTIHQQDIRRPLGLPRSIPPERLTAVLEFAKTAPTIGARRRLRGLRLVATDLDWATGTGPEVTGPGEALLMALAGRHGITEELAGPGLAELARRIET